MKTFKIFTFVFLLPFSLYCQNDILTNKSIIRANIDPDSYSIELSKMGGKWNNKIGGAYSVELLDNRKFNITTSLGGFVNIYDYSKNQSLSWQLWRGNLGLTALFEVKEINFILNSGRFITELSWIHESDHATDVKGFTYHFTNLSPQDFNNGGARSFEYYKINSKYLFNSRNNKWMFNIGIGYKYFSKPQLENTKQMLQNSFLFETGIKRNIFSRGYLYSDFYYENINNSFVADQQGYTGNWNQEPFIYRILETGIGYIDNKERILNLFIRYSKSNGRGLDFTESSEVYGLGLRIIL